jgi:hypothetical protein
MSTSTKSSESNQNTIDLELHVRKEHKSIIKGENVTKERLKINH